MSYAVISEHLWWIVTFVVVIAVSFLVIIFESRAEKAQRERRTMIRYLKNFSGYLDSCPKVIGDRKKIIDRLELLVKVRFAADDFNIIRKSLTEEFYENLKVEEKELHHFIFHFSKNSVSKVYKNILSWMNDADNVYQIKKAIAWYKKNERIKLKKLKIAEKKVYKINKNLEKSYRFMAKPPMMDLDKSFKALKKDLNQWVDYYQGLNTSLDMPISFLGDKSKEPNVSVNKLCGDLNTLLKALEEAQQPRDKKLAEKKEKAEKRIKQKKAIKQKKEEEKKKKNLKNQETDHSSKEGDDKDTLSSSKNVDESSDTPEHKDLKKEGIKKESTKKGSSSREEKIAAMGMGEPNQ